MEHLSRQESGVLRCCTKDGGGDRSAWWERKAAVLAMAQACGSHVSTALARWGAVPAWLGSLGAPPAPAWGLCLTWKGLGIREFKPPAMVFP